MDDNANSPGDQTGDGGGDAGVSNEFVIPDTLKESKSFEGIDSVDGLFQAHHDLKSSQPVIPEAYDYTVPDGHDLDEVTHKLFNKLSTDNKFSQEQYKALMDFDFQRQAYENKLFADDMVKAETELKTEYGEKYAEVMEKGKLAVKAILGPEAGEKLMKDHEFGSNPGFIRFAVAVSKKISEDSLNTGGGGAGDGDTRPLGDDGKPRMRFPDMGD